MAKRNSQAKGKILKAAAKLFPQRGYFGTSMEEIAQEVGVAKSALYYHFESKDALCRELMENSVRDLKKEIKKELKTSYTPGDALFNLIRVFLDYSLKHPEISLLTNLNTNSDKKSPINKTIIELRIELIRFIRETIMNIDIMRRKTRKYTFLLARSLVGLTLNPLLPKNMKPAKLSKDFMTLFFSQGV